MNKKLWIVSFVILILLGGWSMFGETQNSQGTTHVYFFVVPDKLPDGSSSATEIQALKKFLVDTAGGYSGQGESEGGWKNLEGNVETEINFSFFVSCPKDISKELADFVSKHFSQPEPYIITWEATSPTAIFASSVPFWDKRK